MEINATVYIRKSLAHKPTYLYNHAERVADCSIVFKIGAFCNTSAYTVI